MDNKRLVTVILVTLAVVIGWYYGNVLLQRWHPEWYRPPQATTQPVAPPVEQTVAATQPATAPAPATAAAPTTAAGFAVRPHGEPVAVDLGYTQYDPQGQHPYPVGLSLTPRGAAVQAVTLNRFRQAVEKPEPYVYQRPYDKGAAGQGRALSTQSVVINGTPIDLATVEWGLASPATPSTATYAVDVQVAGAQQPLTISKTYELRPKTDKTLGYEVLVRYAFNNQTGAPLRVKTFFSGPNVPRPETRSDIPEVVIGHNNDGLVRLEHQAVSGFTPEKGATSILDTSHGPLLWAGVASAYFDAIVRPEVIDGKTPHMADVKVLGLAPRAPTGEEYVAFTWETAELSIEAGQQTSVPLNVYFGPRQREVLNQPYYATFPLSYDKTLVLTSGVCGWCTFQWLINILVAMLGFFHMIFRDWGLAIIALVIIVRLLLHPITKKSQISMSRMGKMGPEVERLKKKYGDNKDELNKAMMQLYKEQGITPILGCLPMMLQMPIWIALWSALQSTFELRHASFLWGLTWINDLAQPDHLVYFPRWGFAGIPLIFFTLDAINLLPLLMAGVFYLQQKMTPQPAATTPEQEQQQKMMRWMSLLFPVLLYTGPSGLNLYILTSTAIGIWESKRVRDHLKEQEEREKAGKVIVDAKPTRAARRQPRTEQGQAAPQGCVGGWLANLRDKAQQLQEQAEKRYGKGK